MNVLLFALVLLVNPADPPTAYVAADGTIKGTDIELGQKIAAEMGEELKVVGTEAFESIIPSLKAGTADIGIATITITEARQRDVDFSIPYATGGAGFMYRAGTPRPRMSQLASQRVGVESASTQDLYLCNHGCDPVRFDLVPDAIKALKEGRVDAVFADSLYMQPWVEASKGELVLSPRETRECYGVAISKRRPDVLAAANRVIARERGAK